ncbi:hypothetical protein DDD_3322 [Nonlabens dokdonensis DSW-6]|uniref:Uncharacterized protein n=1 Tax=Nonlabens dokdonensis (strain DSM 17205 / KCTC 12402 / DSW-6) TaxID=592029 RepID=L7WEB1_NONDD|nr:hypothetical protein DDD_3322 [Nonlabens dokdonensis DSW-6]
MIIILRIDLVIVLIVFVLAFAKAEYFKNSLKKNDLYKIKVILK